MQGCALFTPAVTRGFGLGQLETVLKSAMQSSGVDGRPSVLLIEDHHITSDDILETVNSLLSAGEARAKKITFFVFTRRILYSFFPGIAAIRAAAFETLGYIHCGGVDVVAMVLF